MFILIILIFGFSNTKIFAEEPLPITLSYDMEKVIFDGKWTSGIEWKRTSLESIKFDENFVAKLRFGHQEEFVYVMLDVVSDQTLDINSDRAMICFDSDNNKSLVFDKNDLCFSSNLGDEEPLTFQGNSSEMVRISNPTGLLGVGGISDEVDIYSKEPHSVFEFRIPTEIIGRFEVYGFFISYYDFNSNRTYTWPNNISLEENRLVPSTKMWGEMISPDKSLPEFELPAILLITSFSSIILIMKFWKNSIFTSMK